MIYAKEFSVSSSRNFMILGLVFMYFIHVEFVFICGVRDNCFAYGCLSFPALLVEKPAFLHVCFCLCRRLIHREFGLTSGSSILFHWPMYLVLCQYRTVLIPVILLYTLKTRKVIPPTSFFSPLQNCFDN